MQPTQTQTAYELHASIVARASEPLTKTQSRAIDLYKRGFNVFPLPYGSKEPFKGTPLKRLYNSRLHLCVESCRHSKHIPTFERLFTGQKNFAVMCGKTSGNLLAVDCDSQTAYEDMGRRLDALALPYWAFTSHRGGCYLLRVIEGEVANVTKAASKFADVELWGNSHYVVVPLSVHPSGVVYRWRGDTEPQYYYANEFDTLPAVSVTALGWLGVTLKAEDKPQRKPLELFGLSAEYAALSEPNRKTLASGATEGERNTRLTALAYDMAANFDRAEIEADFLQAAARCEPSYSKRKALAILKSAYRKERTPAKGANAGAVDVRIERLYAFVNSYDWKATFGRRARTRRAVFMACVARSAIEGETFRASVRELAETVNRKREFMTPCLRDLRTARLLRRVTSWADSASGSGADVYGFGEILRNVTSIPTTCNNNGKNLQYEKNTKTDAWKDVFGRLGDVAGEVFKALQAKQYKSVYAIAKDTGAAYNSVKEAVKRLVTHGLAIHSEAEGLYYADTVTETELLNLSIKLKANGRAEKQRIRHGIDRELFLNRQMAKVTGAKPAQRNKTAENVTLQRLTNGTPNAKTPSITKLTAQPSKAEELRTADFEKMVTAYTEKMGEPPTKADKPKTGKATEWQTCADRFRGGIPDEWREVDGRIEYREGDVAEYRRRTEAAENKKREEEKKRAYELVRKFTKHDKAAEISERDEPLKAAKEFLLWLAEKGNEKAKKLASELDPPKLSYDEIRF